MDSLELLMIKIGALRHVQEAVSTDLKAEIRSDILALLDKGPSKTNPTDSEIVALLDLNVTGGNLVKASIGTPRYRSMGESTWIRQDQLIAFGRSVRAL